MTDLINDYTIKYRQEEEGACSGNLAFKGFCVMLELVFEWDSEKEQDNFRDHGVHFETATNAEERWQTMCFL